MKKYIKWPINFLLSKIFDPRICITKDFELKKTERTSLNRICDISDWRFSGDLCDIYHEIHEGTYIQRKSWESAMCIYGLNQLGVLKETSKAISVGAGHEKILYYFANHISKMIATDIYDGWGDQFDEGNFSMVTNPEKFAPFPYKKENLEVFQMDGSNLKFPDNTFDFAYSLSSIEHFGSREKIRESVSEIFRILKPNGILCIATELILNKATHPEFFTLDELKSYFLKPSYVNFVVVGGDLDLRISRSLIKNPIVLGSGYEDNVLNTSPHIVLKAGHVIFTSVIFFLKKP